MPPEPSFSVVIPTRDRPELLARAVAAVLEQTLVPRELVVVDQSASDEGRRRVSAHFDGRQPRSLPELVYLHDPTIDGLTAARNAGLERCTADWVAYSDDDALADPATLALFRQAVEGRPHLAAVAGVITNYRPPLRPVRWFRRLVYRGPFWDERQPIYWSWSRYAPGDLIPTRKLTGCFMAFRRRDLVAIGGFDERYRGAAVGEDVEISQRLLRHAGRDDALALVAGAWIRHDSLGSWKGPDRWVEFKLVSAHYLYRKDPSGTPGDTARFVWMAAGTLLSAAALGVRRRSLDPIRSFLAGVRCVRADYRDCPFIKPGGEQVRGEPVPSLPARR